VRRCRGGVLACEEVEKWEGIGLWRGGEGEYWLVRRWREGRVSVCEEVERESIGL